MVRIVADSTCDLSQELIEAYEISILPLNILLGDVEYEDGVSISPDEIYEWSNAHRQTPKTSAVSFEKAKELFAALLPACDEIVCLAISGQLSSSVQVMTLAAQELEASDRIRIIDSENLSTGIGLLVIEAAILAREGKCADEIVRRISALRSSVRASFVVDTLEYLHRGGRCGGLAALLGSSLRLHPQIIVENGKMRSDRKYRGSIDKALLSYARHMEEALRHAKKDRVFITHSGCSRQTVDQICRYLQDLRIFDEILITRAGGVISSHCGPGTLGILFLAEQE